MLVILFNEKMKKKLESSGKAFIIEDRGRNLEINTTKWHGKSRGRSKSRGRGCWNCGQQDHLKRNYPRPPKQKGKQKKRGDDRNTTKVVQSDDFMALVIDEEE